MFVKRLQLQDRCPMSDEMVRLEQFRRKAKVPELRGGVLLATALGRFEFSATCGKVSQT